MTTITTKPCMFCKDTTTVTITEEENAAHKAGAFVQDAFAERDNSFRELIISGIHPACWDNAFG